MKMKINTLCKKQWAINVLYVLMALSITIPIVGSIVNSGVYCDSVYYICMGERIAEGYSPYLDLHVEYSPLWFYIEAVYKILFNIPNGLYWPYLLLFHLFQILGAYFLYRLICQLDIKKTYAIFASWLYLIMSHWLQGNVVVLEVPSITFCLLSCWLVIKYANKNYWHYIWIGTLAACSFLVKQYGLGTFVLCLFLMLFKGKCNWKQIIIFVIGYVLPILICLIVWGNAFVDNVMLNGYGTQNAVDAGYNITLSHKISVILKQLNYFCYMVCPIVYFGWLFAYSAYRQKRLTNLIFAYCGIGGYLLVFYFTEGDAHYYQYMLPFAVLLMVELLCLIKETKWRSLLYVMITWTMMVSMWKTYYNRVYKQYIMGDQREYMYQLGHIVKQYVNDETLFVVHLGLYPIYLTADVLPPNMATIGYSFGPMGLNDIKTAKQIDEADWVIRFSEDNGYESFFTDSLKQHLESYPAICIEDSTILLHKMH